MNGLYYLNSVCKLASILKNRSSNFGGSTVYLNFKYLLQNSIMFLMERASSHRKKERKKGRKKKCVMTEL